MERMRLLLVGLPLLLLVSDLCKLFIPSLPAPEPAPASAPGDDLSVSDVPPKVQDFPSGSAVDAASLGGKFHISFCTSCSYKNAATQFKNTLRASFPDSEVILSNHQPAAYKQLLSKLVPVLQFGGIGLAIAGDHVFSKLGYAAPPSWYNTLKQNRFGAIAGSWLIGNALQNALHSTGAFEIYYDGDLVFSKLQEKRFPDQVELEELISKLFERKNVQNLEQ